MQTRAAKPCSLCAASPAIVRPHKRERITGAAMRRADDTRCDESARVGSPLAPPMNA